MATAETAGGNAGGAASDGNAAGGGSPVGGGNPSGASAEGNAQGVADPAGGGGGANGPVRVIFAKQDTIEPATISSAALRFIASPEFKVDVAVPHTAFPLSVYNTFYVQTPKNTKFTTLFSKTKEITQSVSPVDILGGVEEYLKQELSTSTQIIEGPLPKEVQDHIGQISNEREQGQFRINLVLKKWKRFSQALAVALNRLGPDHRVYPSSRDAFNALFALSNSQKGAISVVDVFQNAYGVEATTDYISTIITLEGEGEGGGDSGRRWRRDSVDRLVSKDGTTGGAQWNLVIFTDGAGNRLGVEEIVKAHTESVGPLWDSIESSPEETGGASGPETVTVLVERIHASIYIYASFLQNLTGGDAGDGGDDGGGTQGDTFFDTFPDKERPPNNAEVWAEWLAWCRQWAFAGRDAYATETLRRQYDMLIGICLAVALSETKGPLEAPEIPAIINTISHAVEQCAAHSNPPSIATPKEEEEATTMQQSFHHIEP